MIDKLLCWIGSFIGWLDHLTGSYLIALCLFAILVEILMLPFAIKQQKNSIRQARLRPKEMAIRKKYAGRDDQVTRQKVTAEIQELYQKENFNPMSGCLPLLIQMPIVIALYQIVVNPLHYMMGVSKATITALKNFMVAAVADGGLGLTLENRASSTIGVIAKMRELGQSAFSGFGSFQDVTTDMVNELNGVFSGELPDFTILGVNLGEIPSFNGNKLLLLVPALTFVVYFLSMKLTKKFTYQPTMNDGDKQVACSNTLMDITMPLMSTYIAFIVPALVGVYWMFKSVISTLSRFILSRAMPYPVFTEEDYRAAEREYAGKAPRKNEPQSYSYTNGTRMVGGKPVSRFHMDDDDYVAKVEEEARREEAEGEASGGEKNTAVATGRLKNDARDHSKKRDKKQKNQEDSAENGDDRSSGDKSENEGK